MENSEDFPERAEVQGISESGIYRGKNAACIEIPYEVNIDGRVDIRSYRVWLKRVAMTWEVDRLVKAPEYKGGTTLP